MIRILHLFQDLILLTIVAIIAITVVVATVILFTTVLSVTTTNACLRNVIPLFCNIL